MQGILLAGLVICVVASISTGKRNDVVRLTYAECNPIEGTVVGVMAKSFKEKVEELSGGTIQIDIQAGGVLGGDEQILDNMLGGGNITDLCRVSAMALTQYGCNKASLLSIPYTFVSDEHFENFVDSDLAKEILVEPHEKGLPMRGLVYGQEGFRNFFFKDEVSGLADLKNKKIRASSDPVMISMVNEFGASATSVAFTELYSALSTGVVDGAEQPTANYRSNAFYEVAPYLLLDGHTLGVMQIMISDHSWDKLTEEQQGWLEEAAAYASDVCSESVGQIGEENIAKLKDDGAHIIEVKDKTEWMEACRKTIEENTKEESELYKQILDMKNPD